MSGGSAIPSWADADLCRNLAVLIAVGETQSVEFKAQFPKQLSDLGKEIAAFATTNAGTILLGIGNDGEVCGLDGCTTLISRQELVSRIEGLCAGGVKPAITPRLRFGVTDEKVVVAIDVPKGSAPVYYSSNIPYVRQVTAARPMAPDEVVDAVLAWDRARQSSAKPSPEAEYLSALTSLLVDIAVGVSELELREVDPWLSETRYYLGVYANQLRDLAAQASEECADTAAPMKELAEFLDTAAHEELTLNSGFNEMREAARDASSAAKVIRERFLKPEFFSGETIAGLRETIATVARKQADLTDRIERLLERYKMDELRSEAAGNGLLLRKAGAFLDLLGESERGTALDEIGMRLRAIETRELYFDGGRSQQAIIDDLEAANRDLQAWVTQ